jgi:hypothetical protein
MNIIKQITQVAASAVRNALSVGPDHDGFFRTQMMIKVGRETKPLLLVGNTHRRVGDGHCIAVLNPDTALADEIRPGVGYGRHLLREKVGRRCDVALDIWVAADVRSKPTVSCQYEARKPQPSKFCVA